MMKIKKRCLMPALFICFTQIGSQAIASDGKNTSLSISRGIASITTKDYNDSDTFELKAHTFFTRHFGIGFGYREHEGFELKAKDVDANITVHGNVWGLAFRDDISTSVQYVIDVENYNWTAKASYEEKTIARETGNSISLTGTLRWKNVFIAINRTEEVSGTSINQLGLGASLFF